MGWRLVCQQINHACSQLPGGTYCLFLMHPKHECVRNPLSSNPSVWSVSVQPDLDCMDTRDSVMCLQMLLTPSLWLLGGLGEHWAWFGQTNLIALIMPQLSHYPSSWKCLQHQMHLAFLIQTERGLWKDTSELLSPKYQMLNCYPISWITCCVKPNYLIWVFCQELS